MGLESNRTRIKQPLLLILLFVKQKKNKLKNLIRQEANFSPLPLAWTLPMPWEGGSSCSLACPCTLTWTGRGTEPSAGHSGTASLAPPVAPASLEHYSKTANTCRHPNGFQRTLTGLE